MFLMLLQYHPVTANGEQQHFWSNTEYFFPPQTNAVFLVLTIQKIWLKKWLMV
jgi:hypothetical protein